MRTGSKSTSLDCPWSCGEICVILTQFAREIGYFILTLIFNLKKMFSGKKSPPLGKPGVDKPPSTTTKRVCFVRHGQGEHNRSPKYWSLVDSALNEKGKEQVLELNEKLKPHLKDFDLVVTSPISRAVQTMQGGFKGYTGRIGVNPMLRERLGAPCDFGTPRSELVRKFPEMANYVGIEAMPEIWWSTSFEADLPERVEALKAWIHARPEKTIALVGHGGFFGRILGYHLKNCGVAWVDMSAPASASAHEMV